MLLQFCFVSNTSKLWKEISMQRCCQLIKTHHKKLKAIQHIKWIELLSHGINIKFSFRRWCWCCWCWSCCWNRSCKASFSKTRLWQQNPIPFERIRNDLNKCSQVWAQKMHPDALKSFKRIWKSQVFLKRLNGRLGFGEDNIVWNNFNSSQMVSIALFESPVLEKPNLTSLRLYGCNRLHHYLKWFRWKLQQKQLQQQLQQQHHQHRSLNKKLILIMVIDSNSIDSVFLKCFEFGFVLGWRTNFTQIGSVRGVHGRTPTWSPVPDCATTPRSYKSIVQSYAGQMFQTLNGGLRFKYSSV